MDSKSKKLRALLKILSRITLQKDPVSLFCHEFPKNRQFLERTMDTKLLLIRKKKNLVMWMIDQYGAVFIIYVEVCVCVSVRPQGFVHLCRDFQGFSQG